MEGWVWLTLFFLLLGLVASRAEIARLKRREKQTVQSEARVKAWTDLDAERKTLADERAQQAYERGWVDGEKAAQADVRIEYWTQTNRQQGYFFASKEVLAFTQLMYKDIPIGTPQRHVLEKSEAVDRSSIERMLGKILGEEPTAKPDALPREKLRLVSRGGGKG